MGWDEDGDRAIELEIPYDGAVELYQPAAEALNNTLEIYITQERGSDHSAFRRLNFAAVGITEEYHHDDTTPHIHRTTDTYETIDFDYLESTTRLVVKAMEMLAQEPARKRVCVLRTNMGTMVFRFFEEDVPKTCANFQRLVKEGFYNSKDFYRIVKGHVIQAGGGGETVPAEFNAHKHVFGTLGLGRTGGPKSGNSEIYVCLADRPHLDGKYTVFGQLVEGADVLERIANVEVEEIFRGSLALHKPLKPVVIEEAVIELRPVNK